MGWAGDGGRGSGKAGKRYMKAIEEKLLVGIGTGFSDFWKGRR